MSYSTRNSHITRKISSLAERYGIQLSASSFGDETDVKKVKKIIRNYAIVCAVLATQPLPFADIFILTPIQIMMGREISRIRGFDYSDRELKKTIMEISGLLGTGYVAQQGIIAAYKTFIPYLGAITTIPLVFVVTYAIGTIIDLYFMKVADGGYIDKDFKRQAKKIFHLYVMNVELWADRIGGFIRKRRKPRKEDIEALKKEIADLEESMESMKKDIFEGNYKDINGVREHNRILLEAINECNREICVCSGWVSTSVINDRFITALEQALQRGVNVYLVFGYKEIRRRETYINAKERLLGLCERYPNKLHLMEPPNHYKVLVVDREYYAQGSFNWLSNRMGINIERGTIYYNSEKASEESDFLASLIPDYSLNCGGRPDVKEKRKRATRSTIRKQKKHISKSASNKKKKQAASNTINRQKKNTEQGRPINTGLPWTEDLKQKLEKDYRLGYSTEELSERFGRTKGAILSQLEHQGLVTKDQREGANNSYGLRHALGDVLDSVAQEALNSIGNVPESSGNSKKVEHYLEVLNENPRVTPTLTGVQMACRREKAKYETGSSEWKEVDEACRYLKEYL